MGLCVSSVQSITIQSRMAPNDMNSNQKEAGVDNDGSSPAHLVVESWEKIKAIPGYKNIAGEILFRRIFKVNPGATALFSFASGTTPSDLEDIYTNDPFIQHSTAVISTVTAAVELLEAGEMETLTRVLQDLGSRHSSFALNQSHFDLVGEALLYTLASALGATFTNEYRDAWIEIYGIIATQMKEGHDKQTTVEEVKVNTEAERAAIEIVTKSYILTEIAANQDPIIAEQNQAIKEQRKLWAASQDESPIESEKLEDTQREFGEEEDLIAVNIVTNSYNLAEIAANQDPRIAKLNQEIEQQRRLFAAEQEAMKEEMKDDEEREPNQWVVDTWDKVKAIPKYETVAGTILFKRIFELNPDARALFSFADGYPPDSEDLYIDPLFTKHSTAVISTVSAAVGLLEAGEIETLTDVLRDLGARHASLDLGKGHYELVGEALLYTLEKALGEGFTPQAKQAWLGVYGVITEQMMQGAEEKKEGKDDIPVPEDSEDTVAGAAARALVNRGFQRSIEIAAEAAVNGGFQRTVEHAIQKPPTATKAEEKEMEEGKGGDHDLVVDTWSKVTSIPKYETVAGTILFRRIFDLNPDARALFSFASGYAPDSEDLYLDPMFIKHSTAVISSVSTAVGLLEAGEMDILIETLRDLGARHAAASLDLDETHYDLVGKALLYTLSKALGDAFTPEAEEAWLSVYRVITEEMIQGAKAKEEKLSKDESAMRAAEALVNRGFELTVEKALRDPALAEANSKIAREKVQVFEQAERYEKKETNEIVAEQKQERDLEASKLKLSVEDDKEKVLARQHSQNPLIWAIWAVTVILAFCLGAYSHVWLPTTHYSNELVIHISPNNSQTISLFNDATSDTFSADIVQTATKREDLKLTSHENDGITLINSATSDMISMDRNQAASDGKVRKSKRRNPVVSILRKIREKLPKRKKKKKKT